MRIIVFFCKTCFIKPCSNKIHAFGQYYRQKLLARISEAEETIESLAQKGNSLEKTKQRLGTQVEEAGAEVDRVRTLVGQLEKKQVYFDKIAEEWKNKVKTCILASLAYHNTNTI